MTRKEGWRVSIISNMPPSFRPESLSDRIVPRRSRRLQKYEDSYGNSNLCNYSSPRFSRRIARYNVARSTRCCSNIRSEFRGRFPFTYVLYIKFRRETFIRYHGRGDPRSPRSPVTRSREISKRIISFVTNERFNRHRCDAIAINCLSPNNYASFATSNPTRRTPKTRTVCVVAINVRFRFDCVRKGKDYTKNRIRV